MSPQLPDKPPPVGRCSRCGEKLPGLVTSMCPRCVAEIEHEEPNPKIKRK